MVYLHCQTQAPPHEQHTHTAFTHHLHPLLVHVLLLLPALVEEPPAAVARLLVLVPVPVQNVVQPPALLRAALGWWVWWVEGTGAKGPRLEAIGSTRRHTPNKDIHIINSSIHIRPYRRAISSSAARRASMSMAPYSRASRLPRS